MSIQNINPNIKANCCPHGLPMGACPICSGMGGGIKKETTIQKKFNEWSYAKCYAFWQRDLMQKAQKDVDIHSNLAFQKSILSFQKNIQNYISKLDTAILNFKKNLPSPMVKTVNTLTQKIITPIVNLINDLPNNIKQVSQQISKIIVDISDKLVAIFGELKLNIDKRLQKSYKNIKKSILSLLSIFGLEFEDEDEKKIEDAKRIFEMKILKQKLQKIKLSEVKYE